MKILLNGTPTEIEEKATLANLLDALQLTGQRLAVEVNTEIVPRGRFADHRLKPSDRVEIIQAVGGG